MENAETLHSRFSNTVNNLNIPEFKETDFLADHISQPVLKTIIELRNYRSIVAIIRDFRTQIYYFSHVNPIPHWGKGR